jgi:hypothetical protein
MRALEHGGRRQKSHRHGPMMIITIITIITITTTIIIIIAIDPGDLLP